LNLPDQNISIEHGQVVGKFEAIPSVARNDDADNKRLANSSYIAPNPKDTGVEIT
jgi:hypothetical protein